MYVSITQYGKRYLPAYDFLDLCSKLEITLLGNNTDEEQLQFLEKERILLPVFRVIKPIWYLDYSLKYNNKQHKRIKSQKWEQANQFYEKIDSWYSNYNLFHPFDHISFSSPYFKKPRELKFSKWKTYLERPTEEGRYCSIKRDIQYYPYWYAYHIHEINKACTYKYVINAFDPKLNRLRNSRYLRIHLMKAKRWTRPFENPENLNMMENLIVCHFIYKLSEELNKSILTYIVEN